MDHKLFPSKHDGNKSQYCVQAKSIMDRSNDKTPLLKIIMSLYGIYMDRPWE